MSSFTPALKALINSPKAKQAVLPASPTISHVYRALSTDAIGRGIGVRTWLAVCTAATVTLNSPDSLRLLHKVASQSSLSSADAADFMREVGLKCISFSGIPRTILNLTAISDLPSSLSSTSLPSRSWQSKDAVAQTTSRGRALWSSIYAPPQLDKRLTEKLAKAHPNLPVIIQESHYGALLADPSGIPAELKVGRALASVVAVAALRAQGGVGVQVTSHVRGLGNAVESLTEDEIDEETKLVKGLEVKKEEAPGVRWLATDDGAIWLLESVDQVVESIIGDSGERSGRSKL